MLVLAAVVASGTASAQTAGPNSAADTGATPQGDTGSRQVARPGLGEHGGKGSPDEAVSHAERDFLEQAAQSGLLEIKVGQVAEWKASDPAVKALATRLVEDHTRANGELMELAKRKNMKLPDSPDWHQRHELDRLGRLAGPDFDQRFARQAVQDHERDIQRFQKALGTVHDPALKAWITKTLPVLREHLALARKLPESSGGAKPDARHSPAGASS